MIVLWRVRALLRDTEHLPSREVAKRLDREGFKPRKYSSYTEYLTANQASFMSWRWKELAASRKRESR